MTHKEIQMEFSDAAQPARPTHRLSLTVATSSVQEWSVVHQYLSRMAAQWGPYHEQVSISSVMLDDNGVPMVREGGETHTEETLMKVHMALVKSGLHPNAADNAVREMQNAGILFRERI